MRVPTPLGKLIREIRCDLSITQKQFGEKINVTAAYISAIEVGKKTLSSEKINEIIENFTVSPDKERKLKAFAVIQSPFFQIHLDDKTSWEKRKLAYLFSKKLPVISEETVEKIVEAINSDKGK